MEPIIRVLVDTNIFIKIFREKDSSLEDNLLKIPSVLISTIVLFEILQGEPNKTRYRNTKRYIEEFDIVHLNEEICALGLELLEKYKFSNGLKYPDALIAATCLAHDLYLWTYNRTDFKYIPDLKLL